MKPLRKSLFGILGVIAAQLCDGADDSVVLGSAVSNKYLVSAACDPGDLCMDSYYLWVMDARKTVAGPPVKGRIMVMAAQHAEATSKFVRSVRLFVVSRINNAETRRNSKADYSLLAASPLYEGGRYCLPMNPNSVGLPIEASHIVQESDSGFFCFPSKLVR